MGVDTADTPTIQGLWVGSELSTMEELSIASFLHHGHAYVLYVYEDVANIPAGTIVKDANAILPASAIFQYPKYVSYAGFADFFRYKLLREEGGWWADTDMICLRPFDFASAYVFATQSDPDVDPRPARVTNSVIKAPASSESMSYAWQVCQAKDTSLLEWGETGPRLLTEVVEKFGLQTHVRPRAVFCPIGHRDWELVLNSDISFGFAETTHAVHLWNEMWRRAGT